MLGENIKLAFASIAANKLRSFLTMLGIIIGVASVISIMTLGNSETAQTQAQYASFGTNRVDVYLWLSSDVSVDDTSSDNSQFIPNITEEMMTNMLKAYGDRIKAISVEQYMNGGKAQLAGGKASDDVYANVSVEGVNPGYFTVEDSNVPITAGRIFGSNEVSEDSMVCVVSDKLVNNLFEGDVNQALGQRITVPLTTDEAGNETTGDYTIIGVYSYNMTGTRGGSTSANSEKDVYTTVYIPYLNAKSYVTSASSQALNYFSLEVKTGEDVIAFSDELQAFLTGLLGDKTNFQFTVSNNKQWIEEASADLKKKVMNTTMIGAIALLVGGIGVMNIMTVSITERTREIGTRKALGAPNRDIRMQFITEAAILSLLGGIIGIVIGIGISIVGCLAVEHIPLVMSWQSIAGSFGVSLAIGVFFGYYPANRAAKMDPIEALRYE